MISGGFRVTIFHTYTLNDLLLEKQLNIELG